MPYAHIDKLHDAEVQRDIVRQKSSYITKAARSVTAANLIAPVLCWIAFKDDVDPLRFKIWLAYMALATLIRTWTTARLEHEVQKIQNPQANLAMITLGVGLIGFGWGLGWLLLAPDLTVENRLMYMYITTGGMFNSMFAYCVHWPAFFSFTLPIVTLALVAILLPPNLLHWVVAVGLVVLFIYVFRIARNFAASYEESLRLRWGNERLYRDLAAERDASVAANVAKSNFIAAASHDLRQPLHAVNVYLDALNLDRLPPAEQKTLGKIKGSVTVLNDMFESLLNISRLDSYTFRPNNSDFSVQALSASLDEIARPLARKKNLQLHFDGSEGQVHGDMQVMHQILMNLLSNAICYTEQGQVDVRFRAEDGCLTVAVGDTGCGIDADEQGKIFDEFYRVNQTRAQHDGLGLGLSIVKRLCALIDAHIEVQSVPGQGTVFTLHTAYPLSEGPPALAAPSPATHRSIDTGLLQARVVAVIEDDPVVCQAYRQTLAHHGATVVVLPEEPQQLDEELGRLDRLDLIISDYRLKHTHGDVLIEQLREAFNQDIPAIIVTADTSPACIEHFQRLGVPVLHKPVSFRQVVATAERLIMPLAVSTKG